MHFQLMAIATVLLLALLTASASVASEALGESTLAAITKSLHDEMSRATAVRPTPCDQGSINQETV
jgi:hypothetical protein